MGEPRYVTLMASLPYHGRLFGARQTPLSRFQLDKRLAWLDPDDREVLRRIEDIVQWRQRLLEETDVGFLARARDVVERTDNPLLCEIVGSRLEARTLIAALRRRKLGRAAPGPAEQWGYGRWVNQISRHWNEADFGLGRVYPWALEAEQRIREDDVVGLERLFLSHAWRELGRMGAGHYFDFEAVAVYVLRWDLINRWTRYDADGARERILELTESGLPDLQQTRH